MDLVDEQDVVRLQVGQDRGQVAGARDDRTRGGTKADPHLARHDLRQRRLAEPRGTVQEHVIERLAAAARGINEDPQVLAQRALADELVEASRPERQLGGIALVEFGGHDARVGHAESSLRPALMTASSGASAPSSRVA